MLNLMLKYSLIFLFSLLLVLASVYVIQKGSMSQEKNVYFGYPLAFAGQSFYNYDTVNYYQKFNFKKMFSGTEIFIDKLFASVFIVFVVTGLVIFILELIYSNFKDIVIKMILKNKK